MNSKLNLCVNRSLELLGQLKRTTSDFAKSEEEIFRDLRAKRHVLTRKQYDATTRMTERFSVQTGDVESAYRHEEQRIRALHDGRAARIKRMQSSALRTLPRRAQEAKGNWLGSLQMRQINADRGRVTKLEEVSADAAQFNARLAEKGELLARLEHCAAEFFGGYGAFRDLLGRSVESTATGTVNELYDELRNQVSAADEQLVAFRKFLLPRFFAAMPLAIVVPFIIAGGVITALVLGIHSAAGIVFGFGGGALLLAVFCGLYFAGKSRTAPAAEDITTTLAKARNTHSACAAVAASEHNHERERVEEDYTRTKAEITQQWSEADSIEANFEKAARDKLDAQVPRALAKNESLMRPKLQRIESERASRLDHINREAEAFKSQLTATHTAETTALDAEEKSRTEALSADWNRTISPIHEAIQAMNIATSASFPAWDSTLVENWLPPKQFTPAAKFAHLDLDLTTAMPKQLAMPGGPQVSVPLTLAFPEQGSLLFETNDSSNATVLSTLNNIILRLLSTTPPGKLSFTIIDPVGLGQGFAGLMHLSDYEESLINRRIWTQRDQIEERLAELSEHIEKVIQMYLRNEYETITQYNEQAGSVAEKYHFLVVSDFPAGFSETTAKRLQSIATSGARCGVFTLIHWDQRQPLPDGFAVDELRKNSVCIRAEKGDLMLSREQAQLGANLVFDPPPHPDLAAALVHKIGKNSIDSNRVEVPFAQIAPPPAEMWTGDTTQELRVAIGRTGATKMQMLAIGKGTRQHALFAGKTGSGKSTLFHVIITNLALACSPDQVEFYLIDFKKGVEFKCYASKRLPHARVVAIESDREFALSVLQRVDEELKRRGDIFRKMGVQDIAGYKRAGCTEPMPRSLLLIDEFQEFFVDDDTIAQTASLLFDRIVRQGRAFGIHVLLGSQSLGGAYSLARATLGQMVIRVALQCNEADAYLIMDDSNSAPRLLSRPGEGIYNDAGGALEGNSPFQVVWLPDDERDEWLDKVSALAAKHHDKHPSPIVFEGNAPADLRENDLLSAVLDTAPTKTPHASRCWLGAPNSIKGPTEVVFRRQSGNHLLIVGQREEAALSIIGLSMLALAAQHPVGTAKFVLLHGANPDSPDEEFIGQIAAVIPHEVKIARGNDIAEVMSEIAAAQKARASGEQNESAPSVFFFIHGLHKFKKLRHEDDFSFSSGDGEANPGSQFIDIITEGSTHGIHIIATVDTYNNVNRAMSRKALTEFEMRVVFQMGANDSASLIDSPKASTLGLHRALYYNEQEGTLETFRPYAMPDSGWIREAAEKLAR